MGLYRGGELSQGQPEEVVEGVVMDEEAEEAARLAEIRDKIAASRIAFRNPDNVYRSGDPRLGRPEGQ